jgi:GNAT superfamily N-acetyltransferase
MIVRDAHPRDAAEVAGVHVRSWQAAYRGMFGDDYLDGLRPEDRIAHYTFGDSRPGRPATIVAVADATICGFATTGPSRDEDAADAGELYALYIDPRVWGRGIGRSLIAEARARLSRQGFAEAIVWVLVETNKPSASTAPMAGGPMGTGAKKMFGACWPTKSVTAAACRDTAWHVTTQPTCA